MNFSDEQLMAFADGELGAEERAAIEAASARDPGIAKRIERYRTQRELLRRSFDEVLKEPVPERLLNAARTAPMAGANVLDLDKARAARATKAMPRMWAWPQWTAMAASLLVGLILGQTILTPRGDALIAARDGDLVADGDLAVALTNRPSGEAAPIAIGMSYRAKSGEYCRTFVVSGDGVSGVACREGDQWSLSVLSQVEAPAGTSGQYRMAGAELSPVVLRAVEQQIDGEPLDAAEENAARLTEWRE